MDACAILPALNPDSTPDGAGKFLLDGSRNVGRVDPGMGRRAEWGAIQTQKGWDWLCWPMPYPIPTPGLESPTWIFLDLCQQFI